MRLLLSTHLICTLSMFLCDCSWVTPPGVFQAYVTYASNGYLAHLAWAAAWMCKYDASYCAKAGECTNCRSDRIKYQVLLLV